MAYDNHKNLSYSLVATTPTPAISGTTLVLNTGDGAKFPEAPFNATIWPVNFIPLQGNAEIVRVTGKSIDTLTILRSQEGSTARTITVGDQIAVTITAKNLTDIEDATPTNLTLLETYTQTEANLSDAVVKKHEHANKAILDTYTQSEANISDAITNKHTHANKALLDTYTNTDANISTVISKQHDHTNLSLLETYDQTNINITDSVSKKHAHTNLPLLETYTASNLSISEAVTNTHSHLNTAALSNVSGINSGDENEASIKTKLGIASTSEDGYLTGADFTTFFNKAAFVHTHDDRYFTETEVTSLLSGKQSTLVSATNIKTINGTSILGSGNIAIEGGSGGGATVPTGSTMMVFWGISATNPAADPNMADGHTYWNSAQSVLKVRISGAWQNAGSGAGGSGAPATAVQWTDGIDALWTDAQYIEFTS